MKLAIAQYSVVQGSPQENLRRIQAFAAKASAAQARLLVLPEMCTTGFSWSQNRATLAAASQHLKQVAAFAAQYQLAICGSFLEQTEAGNAANTFYFINSSGAIEAKYRKVHLFTVFGEDRQCEAGTKIVTAKTEIGPIGCSICYDLRFPELFRRCALAGARIQILPAAFPHPRLAHWQTLIRARAIENQCYFIAANQCGHEAHSDGVGGVQYFGHSMVVDPWGEVVVEAGEDAGLNFAELDLTRIDLCRDRLPALRDRRPDCY